MDEFIKALIKEHLGSFMDKSRDRLALTDKDYVKDNNDADMLEDRYKALNLNESDRMIIDDYIACLLSRESLMADISYFSGVSDSIKLLHKIGAIKELGE